MTIYKVQVRTAARKIRKGLVISLITAGFPAASEACMFSKKNTHDLYQT